MMDCLYIFLFMLHFSAGCDLLQQWSKLVDVTGYLGGSVVLPCSCTEPQAKPHQLKWTYYQGGLKEMFPSVHIERYKNRVTLLNQTTPGNFSLLLSSLTKEDKGDYQCSVSPDQYTFIRLHVKGCDIVRKTLDVTGYLGESVVLPCSCTEPQAKPHQLKWTYYQGGLKEMFPSEHIERYKNRVTLLNQNTPGNLSLLLSSLTKEDKGDYQCSVSPDQLTFIRLHVKERSHVHTISTSQPSNSLQQEHITTQPQEKQTHHTTLYVFCVKPGPFDILTPGDAEEENI
ncbi:hypothetical protein E1301_Tti008065 [Triplophysa tibetana]|uniref:Ig-like domain-containing protein n=1 Tax=Triplophysa tibetana TaxID=1572043 RepID=A0A5A9NIL3_9TELE|nr:hypothetical protein E1301_Tti008065 [Triplophysa tibetana]